MMEGFGLAGMAEIPVVIAHVQRVGPSTGMPTKNEQSDLKLWVYGSHGDFPRIVISPGTIEECYDFTVRAFNLAEKYQCPVILLTEQDYGQNYNTVKRFDLSRVVINRGKLLTQEELSRLEDYKRYAFTPDGISPRVLPSMRGGLHMVESNEHDESGYRNEEPEVRTKMMDKRMRKLRKAFKDLFPPRVWGSRDAEIGIIGCGSTFGPIQEALARLKEEGIKAKHLQVRTLWPFFAKQTEEFIKSCRQVFVVENNYEGQLRSLMASQVKAEARIHSLLKYSGQSFRPVEVSTRILDILGGK